MSEIKRADYMVDNGEDFDKIYFSTGADQVSYAKKDGSEGTLQDALGGYTLEVVDTRPSTQADGVIYFVKEA